MAFNRKYPACYKIDFKGEIVIKLYDENGDRVGTYCVETGRAQIGCNFFVVERACHNLGGEEGTNFELYDFGCSACGFCGDICEPNYCPYCGAKVVQEQQWKNLNPVPFVVAKQ